MGLLKSYLTTLIDNQAIADFTSESREYLYSRDWDLIISKSGADGNPLVTLEVSHDNVNWFEYNNKSTDVAIDEDYIRFVDEILPLKFMRVKVVANGVTTGTINATLYLKNK